MPAAQGEVTNREIRFTLRFRRTITIAATSASSSFVIGPAQHAAHAGFQQTIGPRVASAIIREHASCRNSNSRAMTRLSQQAEAKLPGPANDPYEFREISAPDALASAIGALQRKPAFRGDEYAPRERGRRRTRQDQISFRAFGAGETADS